MYEYDIKTIKQLYVFLYLTAFFFFVGFVIFSIFALSGIRSEFWSSVGLLIFAVAFLVLSIFTLITIKSVKKEGRKSKLLKYFLKKERIKNLKD